MEIKQKPYVEIRGIREQVIIYPTKLGEATILSHYLMTVGGVDVYPAKIAGHGEGYIKISDKPDLVKIVESANVTYYQAFLARYPGIYELVNALNNASDYRESFERMMEDEDNDGVNPPACPVLSIQDAKKMYPIADAYLTILRYAQSDPSSDIGYNRRCWGELAFKKIEDGMDVIGQLIIIKNKESKYVSPNH